MALRRRTGDGSVTSDTGAGSWHALALLSAVQFMVVLDTAIVNVALPSIQSELGFSQSNLQWILSAYVIALGGFVLLGGRAADLLGRRRMLTVGLAVFGLSSLLAGLAWNDVSLVSARGLQGLGAALISPAALSLLTATFREGADRNVALGVWGAVGGLGGAAGMLLGGVITATLGWEWAFFVNLPVVVVAIAPSRSSCVRAAPARRVGSICAVRCSCRQGSRRPCSRSRGQVSSGGSLPRCSAPGVLPSRCSSASSPPSEERSTLSSPST